MPKIEKRGNMYRARVSTGERLPNGAYQYITLSASTESELKHMIIDYEEDRDRMCEELRTGNITLEKAMEEYIRTCRAAKRSPSTLRGYIAYQKNDYGALRKKHIRNITRRDLQRLIDGWTNEDGLSPKTIRNKLDFLACSIENAGIEPPTRGLKMPERETREVTIPEDADVQRALFYLRTREPALYLAVVLASTLGLRRGEICALTLEDFDFMRMSVSITKSMVLDENRDWQIKSPKTRAGRRMLAISPLVKSAVQQYGKKEGQLVDLNPSAITVKYGRIRKKVKVPGRFHDLRHYKASVMAALGVPPKYAQEIMGHATMDMLNRVYQHTLSEKRIAINDMLSEHEDTLLSGEAYDYAKN